MMVAVVAVLVDILAMAVLEEMLAAMVVLVLVALVVVELEVKEIPQLIRKHMLLVMVAEQNFMVKELVVLGEL